MHPDETAAAPPPAPEESSATTTPPEAPQAETAGEGATAVVTPAEPGLSPVECGARLAELFPALFVAPGAPGPFKPIKLRIHADILARAPVMFSKRVLGIFFSRYTTSNAYLKALTAPGAQRFDLDGQAVGEIAEEHLAAAVEELARRHAIAAERRAAQQQRRAAPLQQQREQAPPTDAPTSDAGVEKRPRPPRPQQRPQHQERQWRDEQSPRRDTRPPARGAPQPRPPRHGHAAARAPSQAQAPSALPSDPAQRERALLLRAFESSPLSKANFCALKRISEPELDALLEQARTERR